MMMEPNQTMTKTWMRNQHHQDLNQDWLQLAFTWARFWVGPEMDLWKKRVKSDCEELLSRFQQTDSVRFEVFSSIWREMKFSHIFYGTVAHKRRTFSRLVLDTAYCYLLPPFSFQIRVGGLYLLYSLYQSQTASPQEQIRLALKDWDDVKKFEKDAVDAQHFDVVYIIQQLMFCKAFHFTAMPTVLFFKKNRNPEKSVLCERFLERACRPQELINIDLLEEMSNIHEMYEKMKTSAICRADSSVNLLRKDAVSQLRSTVMDFYKWQRSKDSVDEAEDGNEATSSQQECSKRAELLASIKSKAFGEAAETSKSRRHRQVEMDGAEPGPGPASLRARITKPSLKSRTKEAVRISGDVWKEADSTTQINRLVSLESCSITAGNTKMKKRFKRE
ncbi:snRNA-activating protein complex subunit 1b [Melanotaenia boesemani]|uniref:snRNA-activating protein complex subunit 1b n=1 Tax=Melanotaenia boesemani TaxID=1250792 RepID=UPI001C03CE82|nr:snRNA-activating protein complex subunit 1b [Melanotaenia boesemani]